MAFTKRDIKDRVVEHPHRYQLNPVSGQADVYDLSPITGTVVEGGTAINKIYLQPIEDTLEDITTPKYGIATGTNSYVVTVPKITVLVIGLQLMVKFTNASTGATSINVNGLGSKSLIKAGGGSPKIKANGIYTIGYDGTSFQLLGEGGEYGTAQATDVLSGKTIGTDNGLVTGTIPSRGASTITPSASSQTIASGQYLSGTQTISAVAGLSAGNIKNATVVGGVTGTYKGLGNATTAQVLATRTFSTATLSNATGTMVNRGAVTNTITTQGGQYTIPVGYHSGAGKVTASFPNLVAGNVKSGVNIGGVVGNYLTTYSSVATGTASTILNAQWQVKDETITLDNTLATNKTLILLANINIIGDNPNVLLILNSSSWSGKLKIPHALPYFITNVTRTTSTVVVTLKSETGGTNTVNIGVVGLIS